MASSGTWVSSLWPSDAIWWHRSGWVFIQVMTCCLTAPSHYFSQYVITSTTYCFSRCWLEIIIGIHPIAISQKNAQAMMTKSIIQNQLLMSWFGSKPLPEPILIYCQLDSRENNLNKWNFFKTHKKLLMQMTLIKPTIAICSGVKVIVYNLWGSLMYIWL